MGSRIVGITIIPTRSAFLLLYRRPFNLLSFSVPCLFNPVYLFNSTLLVPNQSSFLLVSSLTYPSSIIPHFVFPIFLISCLPQFLSSSFPVLPIPCLPHFLSSSFPVFFIPCLPHYLSSPFPVFLIPCLSQFLSSSFPVFLIPCLPHFLSSSFPLFIFSFFLIPFLPRSHSFSFYFFISIY